MPSEHHNHEPDSGGKYICPMHPDVGSDTPGLCLECGMRLITTSQKNAEHTRTNAENGHGYDKHPPSHKASDGHGAGHSTNIFKAKFWVSLILSVPIVAYSDITQKLTDYRALVFPGSVYLPLALASVIFFYGGWVFIASAYRELKARLPGMMTLIALAISVAYIYSVAIVFLGRDETLFWELSTLITIMLLGHWLEMRAVSGAQSALKELSRLLPDQAEVIRNGSTVIIPLSELKKGDVALVKPGGRIPTDGVIQDGDSDLNESVVTGESRPVSKKKGDMVIAGTTNGDGSLKITVTKIGEETFLAGVMRLVAEAQSSKSRLQMLSDKAAYYLTLIAVVTGGITLAVWLALADAAFAVNRMVAVLVIACPHALGLAIPLVASISTTKAARNGFLVKQRLALEMARNIDVVLFDKTGTLTKGEYGITQIIAEEYADQRGMDEDEILFLAASVNSHSEHPTAKAIMASAKDKKIIPLEVKNFRRIPGRGVEGSVESKKITSGSEVLFNENDIALSEKSRQAIKHLAQQGKTINLVAVDNKFIGAIAMADVIREESRQAIQQLKTAGLKVAMITGDSEEVAAWVAKDLGIDEYFARVLPGEKADKVKLLQQRKLKIAMVGDGVNDAPALAQADLGIAIGAGTNVAIESAGIILVRNDPRDIAKIISLSKATYRKMIQNLFWATGYNIVAIPMAAGVLAFKGILLQPALAAVLMSLSTVIVAVNAVLLKNKKI